MSIETSEISYPVLIMRHGPEILPLQDVAEQFPPRETRIIVSTDPSAIDTARAVAERLEIPESNIVQNHDLEATGGNAVDRTDLQALLVNELCNHPTIVITHMTPVVQLQEMLISVKGNFRLRKGEHVLAMCPRTNIGAIAETFADTHARVPLGTP